MTNDYAEAIRIRILSYKIILFDTCACLACLACALWYPLTLVLERRITLVKYLPLYRRKTGCIAYQTRTGIAHCWKFHEDRSTEVCNCVTL